PGLLLALPAGAPEREGHRRRDRLAPIARDRRGREPPARAEGRDGRPHPRAPRAMSTTQDTIVRLLRNLGSRKEVEQYLKQTSSVDAQRFAVVRVGGGVLAKDLDGLASSLSFLQSVGLSPIVVHGPGPELAAALAEGGVETTSVDGRIVTTPRVLEIARR